MSKYPMPTSPESVIWNKLRFHSQTSTELLTLINNANVWKDRSLPVERAIGRLRALGWSITETTNKKTEVVTYSLKK